MVIKMMLHAVYLLIVLVSLAGNEDDITLLCHHGRGTDGLLAVDNREDFLFLRFIEFFCICLLRGRKSRKRYRIINILTVAKG